MPQTSPPPPGWYGDPAGAHGSRWWDGHAWTDQVRDTGPGDDPPLPPPGDAAPRTGRRAATVAAAVVLVLVAATAIGLRPGGTSAPPVGQVQPGAAVPPPLDPGEVADRTAAAGCRVVVDGEPMEDRRHLDPATAPPASTLYPDRPAHSGPHLSTLLPLPVGTATVPLDERAVLHNMEHGSVVVWFDATAVAGDTRRAVAQWRDARAELGFTSRDGGAVFASPMPDLGGARVPAVALRAWGVAVDCDRFDPVVADAFLVEHWGSHGAAPEADLSPYPEDSLRLAETA